MRQRCLQVKGFHAGDQLGSAGPSARLTVYRGDRMHEASVFDGACHNDLIVLLVQGDVAELEASTCLPPDYESILL